MFRILGCKNISTYKKIPEQLLKYPNNVLQVRCYSGGAKKKSGHPILYTLGFTSLTVGGVVAYAKFDNDFRLWLEENVPGSDKFIELATQEKGISLADVAVEKYENIKTEYDTIKHDTLEKIEDLTGFKFDSDSSTSPGKSSLLSETPKQDKVVKPPAPPSKHSSGSSNDLKSFADFEQKLNAASKLALESFSEGVNLLNKYDKVICQVIEEGDSAAWAKLKTFKNEIKESISVVEVNASDALKSIEKLKDHISDPKFQGTPDQINALRYQINVKMTEVKKARLSFDDHKSKNNITEKYWAQVEQEKLKHKDELEILFPNLESSEKDPALKNLDLLLLYTSNKIQYYQKELAKLEMQYLKSIKSSSDKTEVEKLVDIELNKEKRSLHEEFQKRALELQASFEKDIRQQLKRQAEAHSDHLKEALDIKQAEIDNKLKRDFETQLLEEKQKYKAQIATMIGRMKGFEDAFKNLGYIVNERANADSAVQHSQGLWSACQALTLKIRNAISSDDVKPLNSEIDAIKKSAAKSDSFVETICSSFPSEALSKGVYNEQILRKRFFNVEDAAYRVALVPEDGASLPLVFLSYLQSFFIIRGISAISHEEIRNEPTNVDKLNTYQILERARYFVDRSDLLQAVKYMNLLQGGPKAVSQDWVKDAIVYLETESAAKALLSHAASVSFVHN